MAETITQDGPTVVTKYQCKGCSHLTTEYWSWMGENDDEDSGRKARCMKLDKPITSYFAPNDRAPDWCPFLPATTRPNLNRVRANPQPTKGEDDASE